MSKMERVGERKAEGRFKELLRKLEAAHKNWLNSCFSCTSGSEGVCVCTWWTGPVPLDYELSSAWVRLQVEISGRRQSWRWTRTRQVRGGKIKRAITGEKAKNKRCESRYLLVYSYVWQRGVWLVFPAHGRLPLAGRCRCTPPPESGRKRKYSPSQRSRLWGLLRPGWVVLSAEKMNAHRVRQRQGPRIQEVKVGGQCFPKNMEASRKFSSLVWHILTNQMYSIPEVCGSAVI